MKSIILSLLCASTCACAADSNLTYVTARGITNTPPAVPTPSPGAGYIPSIKVQLGLLTMPRINFREADLPAALQYLAQKAAAQSKGVTNPEFILALPPGFKPSHELTLDLHTVPFLDVLGYISTLAGVTFTAQTNTLLVTPDDPLPIAPGAESAGASNQSNTASALGAGNPLDEPARPVRPGPDGGQPVPTGDNLHFSMAGILQPELSGYIPHRSMGAWNIQQDPNEKMDVQYDMGLINPPFIPKVHIQNPQLGNLIIPRIAFKSATFAQALDFLKQQAANQSVTVSFLTKLPASNLKTSISVTQSNVPFLDALNYFCLLNNATFRIDPYAIVISPSATHQ